MDYLDLETKIMVIEEQSFDLATKHPVRELISNIVLHVAW